MALSTRPHHRLRTPAGFSLVELILVIFIMVLLTLITVPMLSVFNKTSKVQQACNALTTAFWHARMEAIRTRSLVAVYFGDDQTLCNPQPTAGVLPQKGRVEIWTVKTDGGSDQISADESPLNNQGPWYPYKNPDRNLTPEPITLPDNIRVLAGLFTRTVSGTKFKYNFGWNASFNPVPDGEIKRHNIVYSRKGGMPGWFDGLNSYFTVLVFDQSSGEHALIWCGEWRSCNRPRILPYSLTGVYGAATGTFHTLNSISDLPKWIDK
jgi:type II secretory pathway pseudopilin PulG